MFGRRRVPEVYTERRIMRTGFSIVVLAAGFERELRRIVLQEDGQGPGDRKGIPRRKLVRRQNGKRKGAALPHRQHPVQRFHVGERPDKGGQSGHAVEARRREIETRDGAYGEELRLGGDRRRGPGRAPRRAVEEIADPLINNELLV